MRPSSRKVRRDLTRNKGRTILLIAAMTIGIAAVGSVLSAYSIITRELDQAYRSTDPSAATLHLANPSETDATRAAEVALANSDVSDVELRRQVSARAHINEQEWTPLRLLVVNDFNDLRLEKFSSTEGAWPPATGEVLIERSSLDEVPLTIGRDLTISTTGSASEFSLSISGLVLDQGQTPAWMTGEIIGYISTDSLAELGVDPALTELMISTTDSGAPSPSGRATNRLIADSVARDLQDAGIAIQSVDVPTPGEHPAQSVMTTMLFLLQAFGGLALFASSTLAATLVSTQLKQQRREIGTMKAVGATANHVAGLYVRTVVVLGTTSFLIGLPMGLVGARGLVGFTLGLLNVETTSYSVDPWVIMVQLGLAIGIPVAAVAYPIWAASTVPVKDLLAGDALGIAERERKPNNKDKPRTASSPGRGRLAALGLRNAGRTPARTAVTALGIALGGAAFMTALNTGSAWNQAVDDEFEARQYDLAVDLDRSYDSARLTDALLNRPADTTVRDVELWNQFSASAVLPDAAGLADLTLVTGNQFGLLVPPIDTTMVSYAVSRGRWLHPGDRNALVVNQLVDDPVPALGSLVELDVLGTRSTWTVVGVVQQIGGGSNGVAYASNLPPGVGDAGSYNHLRLDSGSGTTVLNQVVSALAEDGITIRQVATSSSGREALDDHLLIIVGLLMIMAILVSIVGGLGLVEAMSVTVLERRRELGVMRALGASTSNILQVVTIEGLIIGLMSWFGAVALSIPMTLVVERIAGELFLQMPLPLAFYWLGAPIWLAIVAFLSAASSAIPALETTELPVHQALALR